MGLGDEGELSPLACGEVLRVLPQREAGLLQRLRAVRGAALAAALGVPHGAADFVQGIGGPLHGVEGVHHPHRVRTPLGDDLGNPVGSIRGHVCDLRCPFLAQQVEEGPQGVGVPARCRPHQAPGVVIDHDGQVLVMLLVGDLVDPDPAQPGQQVHPLGHGSPHPLADAADRAPADPHQLRDRGLRAVGGQPGHRVVEGTGMSGAVPGPGHVGDAHAMLGAGHPRRVRLDHRLQGAQVQSPPAAASLTAVVLRATPLTDPAPLPAPPRGPGVHHDQWIAALGLLDLHRLDHGLVDTEQPSPYPCRSHAVSRFFRFVLSQAETYPGYGVLLTSPLLGDPRKRQESQYYDQTHLAIASLVSDRTAMR
jgi:hypothetical protein